MMLSRLPIASPPAIDCVAVLDAAAPTFVVGAGLLLVGLYALLRGLDALEARP